MSNIIVEKEGQKEAQLWDSYRKGRINQIKIIILYTWGFALALHDAWSYDYYIYIHNVWIVNLKNSVQCMKNA